MYMYKVQNHARSMISLHVASDTNFQSYVRKRRKCLKLMKLPLLLLKYIQQNDTSLITIPFSLENAMLLNKHFTHVTFLNNYKLTIRTIIIAYITILFIPVWTCATFHALAPSNSHYYHHLQKQQERRWKDVFSIQLNKGRFKYHEMMNSPRSKSGSNSHANVNLENDDLDSSKLKEILDAAFVKDPPESFRVLKRVSQANAEGFLVDVTFSSSSDVTKQLFIKYVDAEQYSKKKFADMRRTLLYARTEARFYDKILPLFTNFTACPKVYLASYDLTGLVRETEGCSAEDAMEGMDHKYDQNRTDILKNRGGVLVMDAVSTKDYFQDSPLTKEQIEHTLCAIAKFHAGSFGNQTLLNEVSSLLCEFGGSYHLRNRNPRELAEIEITWENVMFELQKYDDVSKSMFQRPTVSSIGTRIKHVAEYISNELTPTLHNIEPQNLYATIVHGDFKAMNVFLPSNHDEHEVQLIDFASTGIGYGMSDVAMHIIHAQSASNLRSGGVDELLNVYLDEFENMLPDEFKGKYTKKLAEKHFRYAILDYFRFVLGRLWRGMKLENFESRKNSKNAVFVNRDVEAALHFIELAETYLPGVERDMARVVSSIDN